MAIMEYGPDNKMWQVGTNWRGDFFQMRQFPRIFCLDIDGLWCHPALIRRHGRVCWFHLLLAAERVKDRNSLILYPPKVMVITPPGGCHLLEYQDLAGRQDLPWATELADEIGRYPGQDIAGMTIREYAVAESRLLLLYDGATREFAETGRVSPEFAASYCQLMHPAFFRFLPHFVPDFIRAIDQARRGDVKPG